MANRSPQSETGPVSVAEWVAALVRLRWRRSRKSGGGVDRGGQVLGPGLDGSGRHVPGRGPGGGLRWAWVRPGPGVDLGPGVRACVRARGYIRAGVGMSTCRPSPHTSRVGVYGRDVHVPIRM